MPAAVAPEDPLRTPVVAERDDVRRAVRAALSASPEFRSVEPETRRQLAGSLVQVCQAAQALRSEESAGDPAAQPLSAQPLSAGSERATPPLAAAQDAGDSFSGVAADRVAGTTQAILNAVSFPRFVADLLNGVFKAILDSNMQQLDAYVDLLNNVSASLDGFADSNLGPDRARQWLAERYPESFEIVGDDPEDVEPGEAPDRTLRLRSGAAMPSVEALRTDLGLGPEDTVPTGDPERSLLPLARRQLAKKRQEMLATMVMLGMQRIVIDGGRINASMRFHIDTRSAAQDDRGSTLDFRNTINAKAHYDVGIWGVSASMQNTIGYVSTQRTQTTEEMNTELDLNSSVEVAFRSDYLPLNRLASNEQAQRIRDNSRNPEAEEVAAITARTRRAELAAQGDTDRRKSLGDRMALPPVPPTPPEQQRTAAPPASGTPPATGATNPPAGGTPPTAGATNPTAGATNPPADGTPPTAGATNPPAGGTPPTAGATTPPASGTPPGGRAPAGGAPAGSATTPRRTT